MDLVHLLEVPAALGRLAARCVERRVGGGVRAAAGLLGVDHDARTVGHHLVGDLRQTAQRLRRTQVRLAAQSRAEDREARVRVAAAVVVAQDAVARSRGGALVQQVAVVRLKVMSDTGRRPTVSAVATRRSTVWPRGPRSTASFYRRSSTACTKRKKLMFELKKKDEGESTP